MINKKIILNFVNPLNFVLKFFGIKLQKLRPSFNELIPLLIDNQRTVIFEVGANKRQSMVRFENIFKNSEIHAFELLPNL